MASKADYGRPPLQPVVLVVNRLAGNYPEACIEVGHLAVGD
jgi:hypothetical protein